MVSEMATRQRAADTASSVDVVGIRGARIPEDPPIPTPENSKATPRPCYRSRRCFVGNLKRRLLLVGSFVRRARAGRTDEELLAVGERDVATVRSIGAVLGLETLDQDLGALCQRILVPAAAQQRVRRAAFDHPSLHLAGGRILHVDVNPGM